VDVGQIQNGESVLINGAGGGVGMLAVQIAKRYGAEVTGVDSAAKLGALEAQGFDRVMDYREHDFTSDGRRYDLILDTKTTRSPFRHLRALTPAGRYVTVGGDVTRLLQTALASPLIAAVTRKRVRVVALKPNKDLAQLNQLFETTGLHCPIDGPYPLSEVPRALERFGKAEHVGKIVITLSA
jgi:NADPH:quinone reductase-like Zn-dependent oxidoreductase